MRPPHQLNHIFVLNSTQPADPSHLHPQTNASNHIIMQSPKPPHHSETSSTPQTPQPSTKPAPQSNQTPPSAQPPQPQQKSLKPIVSITRNSIRREQARRNLASFAQYCMPEFSPTPFHLTYYRVLEAFAKGAIKRLIISVPPQHGKSLGSSILLPAFVLGIHPNTHIAIASYSFRLATRFNRRIQQLIDSEPYRTLFPETQLTTPRGGHTNFTPLSNKPGKTIINNNPVRTAEAFELAYSSGSLLAVGREGSLTGNSVDLLILDDLFKDAMEANSPIIRDNSWEWYNAVARTRLHNRSQELLVGTRWHEEDLVGRLAAHEKIIELVDPSQLTESPSDGWFRLNFEAIKTGPSTPIDPRPKGTALWPERQSLTLLETRRKLDRNLFEALYQGHPISKAGLLYGDSFTTYNTLPERIIKRGSYTDTADMGDDYLCSLCYAVDPEGLIYILDTLYTQEPMEVTESLVANMFRDADIREATIESNNGGRGFARAVNRLVPEIKINWIHQSRNKEARILSNSATVLRLVRWPRGWEERWPELAHDLLNYQRLYRANRHHDAPDALTGVIETEFERSKRTIRAVSFRSGK